MDSLHKSNKHFFFSFLLQVLKAFGYISESIREMSNVVSLLALATSEKLQSWGLNFYVFWIKIIHACAKANCVTLFIFVLVNNLGGFIPPTIEGGNELG